LVILAYEKLILVLFEGKTLDFTQKSDKFQQKWDVSQIIGSFPNFTQNRGFPRKFATKLDELRKHCIKKLGYPKHSQNLNQKWDVSQIWFFREKKKNWSLQRYVNETLQMFKNLGISQW
jgi:hypothetical protein